MTVQLAIATFVGGFIFPFCLRLGWGRLVDSFGAAGGWMAAGFIVGTIWAINHGVGLIFQSGTAWIDMAWAAGTGLLAASVFAGGSFSKAVPTIVAAILGGTFGGLLLSFILK